MPSAEVPSHFTQAKLEVAGSYLNALVPLLDETQNVDELLTCWSISANGRLGLDYAMVDINLALDSLLDPLEVLAGGGRLVEEKLTRTRDRAHHFAGVARCEKIEKVGSQLE